MNEPNLDIPGLEGHYGEMQTPVLLNHLLLVLFSLSTNPRMPTQDMETDLLFVVSQFSQQARGDKNKTSQLKSICAIDLHGKFWKHLGKDIM